MFSQTDSNQPGACLSISWSLRQIFIINFPGFLDIKDWYNISARNSSDDALNGFWDVFEDVFGKCEKNNFIVIHGHS